jgi:hypothetical protein
MNLSSRDFRTLKQAAEVSEAQQNVIRLFQDRSGTSTPPKWGAEAGMLAVVLAFGLGLIVTLATVAEAPNTASDRQQVVSADQSPNRTTRQN